MSKELIRLTDCVVAFDEDIVLDKINLSIRDKEFLDKEFLFLRSSIMFLMTGFSL